MKILKPKTIGLIIITILLLILVGVSSNFENRINTSGSGISIIFRPFQDLMLFFNNKFSNFGVYFEDIKVVKKENEELKKQIDALKNDNRELIEYRQKIIDFKAALNIKERFIDYEFLGANIIAKDTGNWFKIFTVDRGSKDGLESNYTVITSKGLVGRISTTNLLSSKVISILDKDSAVSARISKTRDLVVVNGDLTLKDEGYCRMDYIPNDIELSVNDTVETSGLGGIFPKGILIGKVKEIRQSQNEFTKYAIIEPIVDFKRLEEVLVLKKLKGKK